MSSLNKTSSLITVCAAALLTACSPMEEGKGGSVVSGSAGPTGSQGAAASLVKCEAPVAVVSVVDNPRGYMYTGRYPNLPESPVPLVRLMLQQSGCFRIVDRSLGLNATRSEMDLAKEGITRPDSALKKQQGLVAQYTITPNLVFSENNAGQDLAGIFSAIPGLDKFAGAASHVKFKEAQVTFFLTDNETTEQLAASEGQARAADLGAGGVLLGRVGGGAAGWSNTNEGKVIAAAMLNGVNKLIPQVQTLVAKQLPPPVPTKGQIAPQAAQTTPAQQPAQDAKSGAKAAVSGALRAAASAAEKAANAVQKQ
jgi:curli biogenesis system outer membrane secretion channel CsgG